MGSTNIRNYPNTENGCLGYKMGYARAELNYNTWCQIILKVNRILNTIAGMTIISDHIVGSGSPRIH